MPLRWSMGLAAWLCCVAAVGVAFAGEEPEDAALPDPEPPAIAAPAPRRIPRLSQDQRFRVLGGDSVENWRLAEELSRLARALEARVGRRIPWKRGQTPIEVLLRPGDVSEIRSLAAWSDGELIQRVQATGDDAEPEDLRAEVVGLLLVRLAAHGRPSWGRGPLPPTPPDWLRVGLAQSLDAATRERDRAWLAREAARGRFETLSEVRSWVHLPPGRWGQKAYAAAAVEALYPADATGENPPWERLLRAGAKARVPLDWLLDAPSLDEAAWRDWLAEWILPPEAAQDDRYRDDDPDGAALRRLHDTLVVRPADWLTPVPDGAPAEVYLGDIDAWADAPWTAPLANVLAMHLEGLQVGASPEVQSVLRDYAAFLEAAAVPLQLPRRDRGELAKLRAANERREHLERLWNRAETAQQSLLLRRQAIRDAVSAVERHLSPDAPAPPPSAPRLPIQRFVDQFDKP